MNTQFFLDIAKQARASSPYPDPRFPPSVYYRFLKYLARKMKPSLSVELGVCGGGGSFHLCRGYTEGQVVGVEMDNEYPENMQFLLTQCPNFYLWRGDSTEAAPGIYEKFGPIDILFIDTTHTYEQTMKEFNAYHPYLSDRAVVILDDLYREGMLDAWDDLPGNKIRLDEMHIGGSETDGGFGVIY